MVELINIKKSVLNAHKKISRYVRETPLEGSSYLSQIGNCEVYLKCENFQLTGSFKIRGAINKLLSLKQSELKQGLVTASSGNHGNAFAYLTRRFGYPGRIILPENASPTKVEALRLMGTDIEFYGDDCVKAERFARESAVKRQQIFISPYNDPEIIG
ncbi:MAG: pyridoxal-phosphate dependent enzyme, partial [Candidatus Aminicenantes bacterium]|nr:pyridoxal-phosphate dependent enzyme [Candidatus Aminicenantes bacterium]